MITGINVINGFATELPAIGTKTFEFTPGFNILFGSNGSGKSTLLKCLKSYCGIEKGGWSQISNFLKLGAGHPSHFPYVYRQYTPNQCDCRVLWDGTPTFYNDGDIKIDNFAWFFAKEVLSEDGMTSEVEQLKFLTDKPSSGQYRIKKLNKLLDMAKNPPNLLHTINGHEAESWEVNYIRSLPRTGRITLLLDEPERALSIPKQVDLFKILTELSKDFQIIVATHSPFILFNKEVNLINLDNGYREQCIEIIKNFIIDSEQN